MPKETADIDGELLNWNAIKDLDWSAILIGNGASLAIWDSFGYRSLFEQAKSSGLGHPLTHDEQAVFDALGTTNFEQVLASLSTAAMVCRALGQEFDRINSCYDKIRLALTEAVHASHVPWECIPTSTLKRIREAVLPFDFVYTTNYDLLLYWSIMSEKAKGFKDYFWDDCRFNIADTEAWEKATKILYLHGALHLYRLPSGETYKQRAEPNNSLLDAFIAQHDQGVVPMLVTEGTSKDKLASIYHSDYLSFAYSKFSRHEGPVVVFGHSLGESDAHLVAAMQKWGNARIAISVRRGSSKDIITRKAKLRSDLPEAILMFFDAETHPLGDPALKVAADAGAGPDWSSTK